MSYPYVPAIPILLSIAVQKIKDTCWGFFSFFFFFCYSNDDYIFYNKQFPKVVILNEVDTGAFFIQHVLNIS